MKVSSHSQQLFLLFFIFFRPSKNSSSRPCYEQLFFLFLQAANSPGPPGAAGRTIVMSLQQPGQAARTPNKSFLRENKTPNNSSTPSSPPRTRTKKPADSAASFNPRTIYPEQALPRANLPPPPTPQGVFWALFVFFVIFCYIYHIIRRWRDILHSPLCHSLKFRKFLKHLLPAHSGNIFVHDMTFINQ
jgi:hypothetical protein